MKKLASILAAALLSGCVNVYTRWPTTDPRIESVYQPSRTAAAFAIVGSFPQMMSDCTSDSDSFRLENILTITFIGLPMAVDTLCEAVLDTVCLPVDLMLTNQRKENQQ